VPPDLVDAGHYRRIERRGIVVAAGTMRAAVRAAASYNNRVILESDVDTCTISFTFNRPRYDGFYFSTSHFLHLRIKIPN
jgi:hypothetical protein